MVRRLSDEYRRNLSEKAKARWAARTPAEKQRHYDGVRIRMMLLNPQWALWPERWIADAVAEIA